MNEIYPGIFMVTQSSGFGSFKESVNIYIIPGTDGLIFDAGFGNKRHLKHFINEFNAVKDLYRSKGMQFNINRILLSHTHVDHFSGLYQLRKQLKLSVILTQNMVKTISSKKNYFDTYYFKEPVPDKSGELNTHRNRTINFFEYFFYKNHYGISFINDPDIIISNKSKIMINNEEWQIFPSPGHTEDHISLYNRDKGILFSGDNILHSIITWLGPPSSDLEKYISSLEYILGLEKLDIILSAHGEPITNPQKRIREIIKWREKRIQDVLSIIQKNSDNGVTINEILALLYKNESRFKHGLARGWVQLTVKYLYDKGKIISISNNGKKIKYLLVNNQKNN